MIVTGLPPNASWANAFPIANGYILGAGSADNMEDPSQYAAPGSLCDEYEDLGMILGCCCKGIYNPTGGSWETLPHSHICDLCPQAVAITGSL